MSRRRFPPLAILLLCLHAACGFALGETEPAQPAPANNDLIKSKGEPLPPGAAARFGSLQWRTPYNISNSAISADGSRVAVFSGHAVTVWDVHRNCELGYFADQYDGFGELAFSPDGKLLASATPGKSGCVIIWDLATGQQAARLESPNAWPRKIAFSPDAKKLIVGGDSARTQVWDWSNGKKLREFPNADNARSPFALSPNGKWLAVADSTKSIWIVDFETGRRHMLLQLASEFSHLAFSIDNRMLIATLEESLAIYEMASGKLRLAIPKRSDGDSCQFTLSDKKLAVFGRIEPIHWLDPFTGNALGVSKDSDQQSTLTISENGHTVVSTSTSGFDGIVRVWDAHSGKTLRAPDGLAKTFHFLAFEANDKSLIAGAHGFYFLNAKAISEEAHLRELFGWWAAALDPSGKTLACSHLDGRISLIDVATRKARKVLQRPDWEAHHLAFGPDGKFLYGVGRTTLPNPDPGAIKKTVFKDTLRIWNVATGIEEKPLDEISGYFSGLAISPQGKLIINSTQKGANESSFRTWDLATSKEHAPFPGKAFSLLFSHDGSYLAIDVDAGSKIRVLDFKNKTELTQITDFKRQLLSWCFSRDNKMLALGHIDGSFTLWSIPAGKKLAELPAHRGPVTALAFSHDGETLVTGSSDGTILKWPAKAWRGK